MRLQVGERLQGSGPAQQPGGYVVTEVLSETPWHGLYAGKKILCNFDFSSKRIRETDENEWLDVVLRTIRYPRLDDPAYVAQRRSLARAEVRFVLGGSSSNLLPEPIDLLELVNTRDAFSFPQAAGDLEPIVVNARPHGQWLSDWQRKAKPIATVLAVLAELLAFIEKSHQEGFILNGMGPASILVDYADRIHYVGTEMMIAVEKKDREAFPPERYSRGFSPPECFAGGRADRRSDLYAFGSVALFLLTGQKPWQIALDQARPWVHFREPHFAALEKVLREVPKAHVLGFLEQIGLGEEAKTLAWPQSFVGGLRRLLQADARRRPADVGQFRRWLVSPPPPPVAALLAWRLGPSEARIAYDATGLDPQLQIVLRRGGNPNPATPTEGQAVFEGSVKMDPKPVVDRQAPAADKPVFYAAFTVDQNRVVSQTAVAELLEPTPGNILRLAHAESGQANFKDDTPALVRLCFQTLEPIFVAGVLFDSPQPIVRSWALRQLHKLRKTSLPDKTLDALLWRGAGDSATGLRRESAREILARQEPTPDLLERLAWTMGGDNLDEAIQATVVIRSLGVPGDVLQQVIDRLGQARPENCPVCQEKISARQRAEHLRTVHGYVDLDGSLLPRPAAMARLWDRVLQDGNSSAHDQMLSFGRHAPAERDAEQHSADASRLNGDYVASLETALQSHPDAAREKLIQCLRHSPQALPKLPGLLRSSDPRLHEVAREVLLPRLGDMLRSSAAKPHDLRRALEAACPGDDLLEEKIQLCYRLPQVGIDENTAGACALQLQEERLVPCPECQKSVPVRDLEAHLLGEHHIYQFRGLRRPRAETKVAVLDALCQANPDVLAGRMLELLAREHGERAERKLVTWLCQRLRKVPRPERIAAIGGVAQTLTAMDAGIVLLPLLLAVIQWPAGQWLSRCLALEIVGRLSVPLADDLLAKTKPLLADRHFPAPSRQRAVVGLLRTLGKDGPQALELFTAYLAQTSKVRCLDKLRELEQHLGKSATLDQLYSETVDRVRMTCPRCGKQRRRKAMVKHLWEKHRLVLDGLRAREPWKLIEDWVVDYSVEKDPDLYHLCRDLSFQLDGNDGVFRLQQLMLKHGVDDPDARAAVFGQAQKQHATICPKCYELLPVPVLLQSAPPTFDAACGLASAHATPQALEMTAPGIRLHVSDAGPIPWLTIETPAERIYGGREPGRFVTHHGAALLLFVPLTLAVFAILSLLLGGELPTVAIAALALGFGLFVSGVAWAVWPRPRPPRDRLIDAAWSMLVPDFLDGTLSVRDAALLGGLAQISPGAGDPAVRAAILEHSHAHFERVNDPKYLRIQAALFRLQAEDARALGQEPMPVLMKPFKLCLAGKKNFALVDQIVAELLAAGEAGSGLRVRTRLLLLNAMFAAGLDLGDLPDLTQAYEALGSLLNIKNADLLISLRYLFGFKADKPWEKCGKARTVFELAAEFEQMEALLKRYPGLLLSTVGQPIFLTVRGVWCENVCMEDRPRILEIRKLPLRKGYDLIVGQDRLNFPTPPDELARSLDGWLDYFFKELMPGLEEFSSDRHGDGMKRIAAKNGLKCPGCGGLLLARGGEVGVSVG